MNLKWNLDDILKIEDFDKLKGELEKEIETIEMWWKKMEPTMEVEVFRDFLEYDEKINVKFIRLQCLPMLMQTINQKDSQARLMGTKADDLVLKFKEKTRKIIHWIKGLEVSDKKTLDDANAKRLFKAIPDLEYSLNYSRLSAKHTLKQNEEEIIDNKNANGGQAIGSLKELIVTEHVFKMGKKKYKSQEKLLANVYSPKAKIREMAYRALLKEYKNDIDKLFVIYQSVVKDWGFEAKIRGFPSPISVTNFENQVDDEMVNTLLKSCKNNTSVFKKYFEYKAKMLGIKKMRRFDLYAPIEAEVKKKIDFGTAQKMVLECFDKFSPRWSNYAKRVFDERHIDSHPKTSKRSGGFCMTVEPKITPYIMMNYTETIRDVSVLAHESGHAAHSMYAESHSPSVQQANLPLAETASTLGETLLFEMLLEKENNHKFKKQMLSDKIASCYASIGRQAYFTLFEIKAHEMVKMGTTAKELSKAWLDNLKEQFGKSVHVDAVFQYEWLYISHIFDSPFYCYAYSFGELLSLGLYARYKKDHNFRDKIEKLFESGGSEEPAKVLQKIGVDVFSESFWDGGFDIIRGWQKQLDELA